MHAVVEELVETEESFSSGLIIVRRLDDRRSELRSRFGLVQEMAKITNAHLEEGRKRLKDEAQLQCKCSASAQ